jgi:hypothetical protein
MDFGPIANVARDILAVWGLFVALGAAFVRLFQPRKVVFVEAYKSLGDVDLRVTVENTSRYPMLLKNVRIIGVKCAIQSGSIDDWEIRDVVEHAMSGNLDLVIAPTQKATMVLVCDPDPASALFMVTWRSQRMVSWWAFPTFVWRSKRALRALRAHPVKAKL